MAKILVIDDDKDILRLLEFTLKRAKHQVLTYPDAEQGLAEAQAQHPDLIVCDVMMPKMTGYEFCKQARKKPALKDTPIIVFSARFQPVDKQTALDAGATDYLAKSTAPDALVQRITELLPKGKPAKKTPLRGMIGVFSLRGGTGVTSLAVNLALGLARSQETPTGLIDLAMVGGHAALMLGLRPSSNVAQLIKNSKGDFGPKTLQPHLMKHNSGVFLLPSPPSFGPMVSLTNERLGQLIKQLKTTFPLNILDLPPLLDPRAGSNLKPIDKIVLVLSPDMPSLQSTAIALQGLGRLGFTESKIILVVNQVTPYNALPVETIQKAIKRPIAASIPFEPNMTKAINSGKPLLLSHPQTAAAKAIGKLLDTLFA